MAAIHIKLCDLGWIKREMEVEDSNDNDGDKEENYIEGSKGLDMMLIYRRALMSFVNHYAGLHILEQQSIALLADENIKLSLIGIKHPTLYYRSWEEMEKVIETCLDFCPSNSLGCLGIITKIEEQVLEMTNSTNNVILTFKTLLKLKNSKLVKTQPTYPPFSTCIHCESSLDVSSMETGFQVLMWVCSSFFRQVLFHTHLHSLTCDTGQEPHQPSDV